MRLNDQRGTLYELPLLVALIVVALAAAIRQPSIGRGILAAVIAVAVFVGILAALVGIGLALGAVSEIPWVNRIMESKPFRFFADWFAAGLLALFMAAAGCFFGIVLAETWFPTPAGQVRFGILSGVVLGASPILYRLWALRGSAKPSDPKEPAP
ncbi:MAG: hypothetical protein HY748_00955 [Elusimicrobia bacterium]|nr:hypothetical protein [Elusimicrobiota bacterium]